MVQSCNASSITRVESHVMLGHAWGEVRMKDRADTMRDGATSQRDAAQA